jgi:O-antigen/teichoic acid export membrane protein
MTLRRNIVANYLGQAWSAVIGLAFIPLYIHYLGIEAYGLIGLFAVLQTALAILDLGMSPTLNREMARFAAGATTSDDIRSLLRSVELVCFTMAGLIAGGVLLLSRYLATNWLKAEKLPIDVVAGALAIMSLVVALRFCENIYRSSLLGLLRLVWYNAANAILATVRNGGAVAVLVFVSPTVHAFFLWQAAVSALTVAVLATGVYRALPPAGGRARFSSQALIRIRRFAGGMLGVTLLSIVLTNLDKLLLSRLVSLESFGYYALASTIAGTMYMLIVPLDNALYPRLVELSAIEDEDRLVSLYHRGAQLVSVLTSAPAMLLILFANGILFAWSGRTPLAENAAPVLSVIACGTFLNGLMHMPYQLQIANGWTSLAVKTNVIAVIFLAPAIFWIAPRYGTVGVAWVWVALNAAYVVFQIPVMHRRLISPAMRQWYVADVLLPAAGAFAVGVVATAIAPSRFESRWLWAIFLLLTGVLAFAASVALSSRLRTRVRLPWRWAPLHSVRPTE